MLNEFENMSDSLIAPPRSCFDVEPSDTETLSHVTKGIYIGVGGDVRLQSLSGSAPVTYKNLADGSYIAVRVARVFATGTTASAIVGEA